MIYSILDTDLYKFSTSYAYMKLYPDAECTFTFVDRNKVTRSPQFLSIYKNYLNELAKVYMTDKECQWCIKNIPYIPEHYWEWLKSFRYDPAKINVKLVDGVLNVSVTDKCYKASLYEIPCLYFVTEVMSDLNKLNGNFYDSEENVLEKLHYKIDFANNTGIKFSEFGTRRRYNQEVQEMVINYINKYSKTCVGTSNVYFAMKYDMVPCGTHPHEWFMFHAAQFGYKNANYLALEDWVNVYDGNLGIALSDTYTSDIFFRNFSLKQAKLFDGVRQDSGDEYEFINKTIDFYKSKGIDYHSKTIVFSNGLSFPKAFEIKKACDGLINCSFGIGTNLTNDTGAKAENIVMKMTSCRMNKNQPWFECIKLSDDFGKHLGSSYEIKCATYELGLINKI